MRAKRTYTKEERVLPARDLGTPQGRKWFPWDALDLFWPVDSPSRVLLLGLVVGAALLLVSVGSIVVAAAFFHSPYTVSFGTPGDTCTSDLLYLDSRTGAQLECVDRRFNPAIGTATAYAPPPWTDDERNEIVALSTTLGGGGLDDAERDQIEDLANRTAERYGYDPAVDNTLVPSTAIAVRSVWFSWL
ncbi:hypothetical protein AAH979_42455 [Plantactinospora sp. ZYX-F-223]|uniref:hypothetical protein n=1 Tax=Plantactinospora sp. ZYX-F-223 TaxID=3144103 RepID=UPI0031FBE183